MADRYFDEAGWSKDDRRAGIALNRQPVGPATVQRPVMMGTPIPLDAAPYEVTIQFDSGELRDLLRDLLKSGGGVELCGRVGWITRLVDPPYEVRTP